MVYEINKSFLSPQQKVAYEQILKGIDRRQKRINCGKISMDQLGKAYFAFCYDHVEHFYLTYTAKMLHSFSLFGGTSYLDVEHIFSDGEISRMEQKMEQIANQIKAQASRLSNVVDKLKLICDYIIKNTVYEINDEKNQNAGTVLCQNKGQCSGISKAVKYLCDYLDIECVVVMGEGTDSTRGVTEAHCWNIVKIADKRYVHLDATFDLGCNLTKREPFNYCYFCKSDEEFARNHTWDRFCYPMCKESIGESTTPKTAFKPLVTTSAKREEGGEEMNPMKKYAAPKPRPFPRFPSREKVGGRSEVKPTTPSREVGGSKPIIYSYEEFKRQIGIVFDKKSSRYEFKCKIKERDGQTVLNNLLNYAIQVGEGKGVCVSLNCSITGEEVSITLTW